MGNHKDVIREIEKLKSMTPGGFFSSNKPDWKAIWAQVKVVGYSFKGVKFPTRDEHQQAWDKFQSLVDKIKYYQKEEQEKWNQKKSESTYYRDCIISQAKLAKPSYSSLTDVIMFLATGGVSAILDAIMGPFDEHKSELQRASEQLKKGWDLLNSYKNNMLGRDKHDAFLALNEAKENLDHEWYLYKQERQKAFDKFIREREAKQQAWRDRTEENIRKLEDRQERLNSVLSHKEDHLEKLRRDLDDAWSDDYRSRVSGWIAEEESNIEDIRNKLSNVENWLYEARSRLNS